MERIGCWIGQEALVLIPLHSMQLLILDQSRLWGRGGKEYIRKLLGLVWKYYH